MKVILLFSIFASFILFQASYAVEPDELLADPVLESRARSIDKQLRCVVCQSQSIDESNAPLAKDLRLLVRERILAGDSDEQTIAYIVDRYGDYVLLKPPLQSNTILLWLAPLLLFGVALTGAYLLLLRRREINADVDLSSDEQNELKRILDERRE